MFGHKLTGYVLTRDSAWFLWGRLVGAAGFITAGGFDPKTLGLTDKQAHVVMAFCAAILAASAQFSSSNLPSKADAMKVSLPLKESV